MTIKFIKSLVMLLLLQSSISSANDLKHGVTFMRISEIPLMAAGCTGSYVDLGLNQPDVRFLSSSHCIMGMLIDKQGFWAFNALDSVSSWIFRLTSVAAGSFKNQFSVDSSQVHPLPHKDLFYANVSAADRNQMPARKIAENVPSFGENIQLIGYEGGGGPYLYNCTYTGYGFVKSYVDKDNTLELKGVALCPVNNMPSEGVSGGPVMNMKGEVLGTFSQYYDDSEYLLQSGQKARIINFSLIQKRNLTGNPAQPVSYAGVTRIEGPIMYGAKAIGNTWAYMIGDFKNGLADGNVEFFIDGLLIRKNIYKAGKRTQTTFISDSKYE